MLVELNDIGVLFVLSCAGHISSAVVHQIFPPSHIIMSALLNRVGDCFVFLCEIHNVLYIACPIIMHIKCPVHVLHVCYCVLYVY